MAATRIELSICLIIEVWNGLANPGSHSGGHGFESRQLHHLAYLPITDCDNIVTIYFGISVAGQCIDRLPQA